MSLLTSDATSIAQAIRSKQVSAVEIAKAFLTHIETAGPQLNCFTDITHERAIAEATVVDAAIAANMPIGPLAGVPYGVKNLYDITGYSTRAGSKINNDLPPARDDAVAVHKLKQAGAVLVGALNMDEFAYGFTTENQHYGAVRNPHDLARIAGGSSGGSAAAVAGGLVPFSLGTDTNGSVRLPAALCGVYGLKPTFGRLDRKGAFPLSYSLDTIGAFSRSVRDLEVSYKALGGPLEDPEESKGAAPIGGLRIAIADDYFDDNADAAARDAVLDVARSLGATRRVTLPEAARARAAAFIITAIEAGNLHLPNLQKRYQDFDINSQSRLLAGAIGSAGWYVQAQRFRLWFRNQIAALFDTVDVILAPASPQAAPHIGQKSITIAGEERSPRAFMGMFTQPISFIGLPVITVPIKKVGQMPLGVQIIAPAWHEDRCFAVARFLEQIGVTTSEVANFSQRA